MPRLPYLAALPPLALSFFCAQARAQHVELGIGVHAPRGDSAYYDNHGERKPQGNGLRGHFGLEIGGEPLALQAALAYSRLQRRGVSADSSLSPPSRSFTGSVDIYELSALPKFYLRQGGISAYLVGGGGPRWVRRVTDVREGPLSTVTRETTMYWGAVFGFGVEAVIGDALRLGFMPAYNIADWSGPEEMRYATFVFYAKL